jgi:hypothetical protein
MSTTILEQIEHLKFHELYDGPINTKLKAILENSESKNNMEEIIDAILHTRDIRQGRGLSHLTYSYLFTLQQVFPAKAVFALYMIVDGNVGSWRDVRCYCEFVAEHSEKGRADPIIKPIIGLYNHQLIKDVAAWKNALATETSPHARNHISYAVRWIPRHNKRNKWLFHMLVVMWVYKDPEYKAIVNSIEDAADAERTCKIMYRKMISDLNKELDRA